MLKSLQRILFLIIVFLGIGCGVYRHINAQKPSFDIKNLPCYPGTQAIKIKDYNKVTLICQSGTNDKNIVMWYEVWVMTPHTTIWTREEIGPVK